MEEKKSEQIKMYIVIGLALVAAIVAYFRFIHKDTPRGAEPTPPPVAAAPLDVSGVEKKIPQDARRSELVVEEPLRPTIRDIFSPLKVPKKKLETRRARPSRSRPVPSKPLPTLKLNGVIVGGGDAIAIINDQFVRTGERIGGYKVVKIGEKVVYLRAGNKKRELKLMNHE